MAGKIVKQLFYDITRFSKAINEGLNYLLIIKISVPGEEPTLMTANR